MAALIETSDAQLNIDKIACMLDHQCFNHKPAGYEVGQVQNRLDFAEVSVEHLAFMLTHGASFRASVLIGGRKAENWTSQQFFGLDFDDGITISEAYIKMCLLGLKPAFMYTTFSHTAEHHKFRAIYVTDEVIYDADTRDKLQATLMGAVGGIDPVCFNRDRLFFGGNGIEALNADYNARINANDVIERLWKDEYEAFISGANKSKKNRKKPKNEANTKSKTPSEIVSYVPEDGNIRIMLSRADKACAQYMLRCLDAMYEGTDWVEGSHRERFIFAYYNVYKSLYGAEKAYNKVIELNEGMDEPIPMYYLNAAAMHSDEHIESSGLHASGFFKFNPSTFAKDEWFGKKKAGQFGFLANVDVKAQRKSNREQSIARDRAVAELVLGGYSVRSVPDALPEELKCSARTVQNIIKRLDLRECKKIENVNFERTVYSKCSKLLHKLQKSPLISLVSDEPEKSSNTVISLSEELRKFSFCKNDDIDLTSEYLEILNSGENVMLQGLAGRGKSYLLNKYIEDSENRGLKVLVTAPTGTAAQLLSGKTVHSAFALKTKVYTDEKPSRFEISKLKDTDIVVIDEVGCLRRDVFHHVIDVIESAEMHYEKPIQVVLAGDYNQTAPVISSKDKEAYETFWGSGSGFIFEDEYYNKFKFLELKKNYRQGSDLIYSNILDEVLNRNGAVARVLSCKVDASYANAEDIIHLVSRRAQRDLVNESIIAKHREDESYTVKEAVGTRKAQANEYPVPVRAEFYIGMKVMCTANISLDLVNGTMGTVEAINDDFITVRTEHGMSIDIYRRKIKALNAKTSIMQFPLAPAYAITIHKAQGKTFERIVLHPGFFETSQLYVAMSRVKTLEGLIVAGYLSRQDIKVAFGA